MESPQYSLDFVLVAGAALTLLGLVLGWMAGRRTSGAAQKNRDLAVKLDQVMQDKKAYENDVIEHFTETAKLLNTLTDSYREVHNHLAQGAASLCEGAGPISLPGSDRSRNPVEIPANLAHIQPPLDYAPKTSPDQKGMLNEEFGLERKPPTDTAEKAM